MSFFILLMLAVSGPDGDVRAQSPFLDEPVPLSDLGTGTYLGFEGGLYPDGSNRVPASHAREGYARANALVPLGADGYPDPSAKIVLMSVGLSNTAQEFCGKGGRGQVCNAWSFIGMVRADPELDHGNLQVINGALPGRTVGRWSNPADTTYDIVEESALTSSGLTPLQVQVIWLKVARSTPNTSLPDPQADAYRTLSELADAVRALKVRYPNLSMVFLSSRTFGGYATTALNPEPYAYENGYAVKWLIEAQIRQMATGEVDPRLGDLSYAGPAPWLAWGPYLWANGAEPRSDGLVWLPEDFEADGTHPSQRGEVKVAGLLMDFFKTSEFTACWFVVGGVCGPVLSIAFEGRMSGLKVTDRLPGCAGTARGWNCLQ